MHPSVVAYACEMAAEHGPFASVLDVGSYDDKGAAAEGDGSLRGVFDGDYVGVDIRSGPGVDLVADASRLPFRSGSFDLVASTEMLEHDLRPWVSVADMARVSSRVLMLTARGYDGRGYYPIHGVRDVWRFSLDAMRILVADTGMRVADVRADPDYPGVFLTAVR